MRRLSTRRSFIHSLALAAAAPSLASCLRPPAAPPGAEPENLPSIQPVTPLAEPSTRKFTHTSTELLGKLKLGWNLGNTLDAPEGETAWGNPKATLELMKGVAERGFRLVRIPVTWSAHTGPAPDFVLDAAWVARVKEIVGYARDAGLYAVINIHHDGADNFKGVEWLTLNDAQGATTNENNAAVRARFSAVWAQIAKAFAEYGEELFFESMNEIHDGYGNPDPRHLAIINELNQVFIEIVRKSGGQNAERHLIVPGYNTNIDHTVAGFKAPADPTANRLSLSVHYYDPYTFALAGKTQTWGKNAPGKDDWGQEDHVTTQFDKLERFRDQGLPIFLGEYGASHQNGYEQYRRYYVEYVTKAAVERGFLPVFWDNGGRGSGAESFGILDRNSGKAIHPELVNAMVRAANGNGELSDIVPPQ